MDFKLEAIQVALLILPGFVSVQVRDAFSPPRSRSDFERFMEALAFSIASIALVFLIHGVKAADEDLDLSDLLTWAVGTAIGLGLIAGIAVGKDWPYRIARFARLTDRSGRIDVWQDAFSDIRGCWLLVHLKDGNRLIGWARYYSDTGERPNLFLSRASWVLDNNEQIAIEGPGILIADSTQVTYVEFLKGDGNERQGSAKSADSSGSARDS